MKIAIVGAGISGLTAAYYLSQRNEVTVFEKDSTAGGHSHTHAVRDAAGELGLDTGFIVYNERTYPNFTRLLAELGVATQPGEMSFSALCRRCRIEYCGSSPRGLFAKPAQLFRPSHYRMLLDILRFNREGVRALEDSRLAGRTLGEFLGERGYSAAFVRHYILPMGGAIWSSDPAAFESFPAPYFLRFFHNHGLLSVSGQPEWRTISGGSRNYVKALTRHLGDRLRLNALARSIRRRPNGVDVTLGDGSRSAFDAVVIAAHSDQALAMLADPGEAEAAALAKIRYQPNEAVLHTDERLLPRSRHARASWNVHLEDCERRGGLLSMTYLLNRLQRLDVPTSYCVTLNDRGAIAPEKILARIAYDHPVYTHETLEAQRTLKKANGERRTYYCG
ncbi:MAG: NAD(P)/FAD-dependent oxidoreductase, partial [Candidatus Binatia bacterium]